MELAVYNIEGKDTGRKITLDDAIFGIEPNEHAVYLDVKQYMANKRQGTHKTKEKWEVTGSTKKLKKQKGTGTARSGSIKSPVFVGGGRVFGPQPRDYHFKLNKKLKQLARKSVLSEKAKNENIIIVEDIKFEKPKTKDFIALQESLEISDKKSLLVLNVPNKNVYLSSRNLAGSKVTTVSQLDTYNILNAKKIVFVESSVEMLHSLFSGQTTEKVAEIETDSE